MKRASAIDLGAATETSSSPNSVTNESSSWFSRPASKRNSADEDSTRQTDVAVELGDDEVNAVGEEVSFLINTPYSYLLKRFFRKLLFCICPCCGCCGECCSDTTREKNYNDCYGLSSTCAEKCPAWLSWSCHLQHERDIKHDSLVHIQPYLLQFNSPKLEQGFQKVTVQRNWRPATQITYALVSLLCHILALGDLWNWYTQKHRLDFVPSGNFTEGLTVLAFLEKKFMNPVAFP